MKIIEISSKKVNSGEKHFKAVLFKIQPDSCLENLTGTKFNLNGITWIKQYCEENLKSAIGKSITVEFTNSERTEILGHGDTGIEDGIPVFNNATVIGHFTDINITDIEIDGEICTACVGEGILDYMRYKPFLDILEQRLNQGETIYGSVEIIGKPENENKIIYLDGWKAEGRVPVDFLISGWAILDIKPSDDKSQLLELNQKQNKEEHKMDETKILETVKSAIVETNSKNADYENQIAELNSAIEEKETAITELNASIEELKKLLAEAKADSGVAWQKVDLLEKEVAKKEVEAKLGELDETLGEFNEAEQSVAKDDIEKLKTDISACEKTEELNTFTSEINSIKSKICMAIVANQKKAEAEAKIAEQNSAKNETKNVDIFSEVNSDESKADDSDVSIF